MNSVTISEFDQNQNEINVESFSGNLFQGDVIPYTSSIVSRPGSANQTSLPRGLSVFIEGVNANFDPVFNLYLIDFTNDCGIFPVLKSGMRIGWTVLVSTAWAGDKAPGL